MCGAVVEVRRKKRFKAAIVSLHEHPGAPFSQILVKRFSRLSRISGGIPATCNIFLFDGLQHVEIPFLSAVTEAGFGDSRPNVKVYLTSLI